MAEGWFGTFGVLPERQGAGIGQRLINASLEYLRQEPGRLIGLETMPDSADNLGLYLSRGFEARMLTLKLRKKLDSSTGAELGLPSWSEAGTKDRRRWLTDLREATGHIRPGLDYTKEILSSARHQLGETVILKEGRRAIGFSAVRLRDRREGQDKERASVEVLAVEPDRTDQGALRALLQASEALGCAHGKREIVLPVNARHTWALEQLLARGYRVKGASVRLVLGGTDDGPATDRHVDLSRWAG